MHQVQLPATHAGVTADDYGQLLLTLTLAWMMSGSRSVLLLASMMGSKLP